MNVDDLSEFCSLLAASVVAGSDIPRDAAVRVCALFPRMEALSISLVARGGKHMLFYPVLEAGRVPPGPLIAVAKCQEGTAAWHAFRSGETLLSHRLSDGRGAAFADWEVLRQSYEAGTLATRLQAALHTSRDAPTAWTDMRFTDGRLEARFSRWQAPALARSDRVHAVLLAVALTVGLLLPGAPFCWRGAAAPVVGCVLAVLTAALAHPRSANPTSAKSGAAASAWRASAAAAVRLVLLTAAARQWRRRWWLGRSAQRGGSTWAR
ncbi:hypothetical protein WJX81_001197 [Elliptochloris bilobata]|uniref:Uncharacterized protein n=1 Tax=Elliptochloris bilobata TaxID=381761 RepID=A0AAW1QDA8_9CHLO